MPSEDIMDDLYIDETHPRYPEAKREHDKIVARRMRADASLPRVIAAARGLRSTVDGTLRDLTEFERASAREWDAAIAEAIEIGVVKGGG